MAEYMNTQLEYAPLGAYKVWTESRTQFSAEDLGKTSTSDTVRQEQFIAEARRLADHIGSAEVPVFVNWPNVGRRRMDKGCIGHAQAAGAIESVKNGRNGYVDQIVLREWSND